tara:strand:+ start:312 stop:1082 length:771 start_codon:yes stop_codon:yes gene_type:complete
LENIILKLNKTRAKFKDSGFHLEINTNINEGETILLIGPNGSGKSTFLKTISRHIPLTQGEIILKNKNIESLSVADLSKLISYMPQAPYIPDYFDVFEFVLSGCYSPGKKSADTIDENFEITHKMLNSLKMKHKWSSKIGTLSGGEKQLVLLAHSLVQNSSIQLFDEPSSSLDPYNQSEIIKFILNKNNKKQTKIISSHDLNLSWKFNRVIMLKNGSIFKDGNPEFIMTTKHLSDLFEKNIEVVKLKNNKNIVLYN